MKLFQYNSIVWRAFPFIRMLPFLLFGILLGDYFDLWKWRYHLAGALTLLFLVQFLLNRQGLLKAYLFPVSFFSIGFALMLIGALRTEILEPFHDNNYFGHHLNGSYQNTALLIEDYANKSPWTRVDAKIIYIKDSNGLKYPCNGKVRFYMDTLLTPDRLGSVLLASAKWDSIPGPKNPGSFDYREYSRRQGILYQSFVRQSYCQWTQFTSFSIRATASRIRMRLTEVLKTYVPGKNEYAVATSLLLGDKSEIDKELYNAYVQTGSVHILAVSGMHVGLISTALMLLLGLVRRKNKVWLWLKLILILGIIWLFVLVAGASASLVRAAVMFSLLHSGAMLVQRKFTLNTLAASVFLISWHDPLMIYDVGLYLSYAAVCGILFLHPILQKLWLPDIKLLKWIWGLTTVTLAAQLFTMPICLYYFHQTSVFFLLSGWLVVPISTFAMYLGLGVLGASYISNTLAMLIGQLMNYCLVLMNGVIYFIQKIPGNLLDGIPFTTWECVLGMVALVVLTIGLHVKNRKYIYSSLVFFLGVICLHIAMWYQAGFNNKLIIYSSKHEILIDYFQGRNALSFMLPKEIGNEAATLKSARMMFGVTKSIPQKINLNQNPILSFDSNVKINYINDTLSLSNAEPDVWLVKKDIYPLDSHNVKPQLVLLNANRSKKQLESWKLFCANKACKFHDLKESSYLFHGQ